MNTETEGFRVGPEELIFVGAGLVRPECVLCTETGDIFVSDWRGGVTRVRPDGTQVLIGEGSGVKPNGIALEKDGSFLLADLGERGGVWRLARDGAVTPFLLEVDGVELPPTNFVLVDSRDRVWVTVSTRTRPRHLAYRPDVADGFIALADEKGARIVAEGLGYTNEVRLDARSEHLYAVETFGRRISRLRVGADGELSEKETFAAFGHGTFPDGLALDTGGGVWVTSIVSNRLIRVLPDGTQHMALEDNEPGRVDEVEEAFLAGEMGRPHLDAVRSEKLGNISSVAFGGRDLRTIYLGCLLGDRLASFRSPVAGLAPVHWRFGF